MSRTGANKVKCTRYKAEHRLEKNKVRKLTKLKKLQPNNKQLDKELEKLKNF